MITESYLDYYLSSGLITPHHALHTTLYMSNVNFSDPVLNPIVYLNYLPPTVANEYEIARDVAFVTFGALLWDILSSLLNDCKLIRTTKFSPVLLAYFSSRTFALAVAFMSALAKTGAVQNCGVMELILCIFWVFTSASSSYLFLKRVHAVLFQRRLVCHAFTALWIAGVGASTLVLSGLLYNYYQIANTKHCITIKIPSYVSAAFIVPVLFDALVFLAISYQILMFHQTIKPTSWKAFYCLRTGALPRLSRAILEGDQRYYMITTGVNVTRSILALSSVPPVLQSSSSIPAVALTSAMACRVYRNLKLEAMQKLGAGIVTTIQFADREQTNIRLSLEDADLGSTEAGLAHGG